ncbi:MAG: ATP-dependent RecD-like DNA helicase [Eubacteriales bacterium]
MELEHLEGTVNAIVFQNQANGYAIISINQGEDIHTVVGTMPDIAVGDSVKFQGEWVTHQTYGKQLKALVYEKKQPEGKNELFRYLSSGTIEGVRAKTAKQLLEAFGDDVLEVMEKDYEKLTEIKGITLKRAQKIHESYCKQIGTRMLLTFLTLHDLPLSLAPPLTKYYGDLALNLIQDNPYLLTQEDFGLPFQRADQLAKSLHLPPDNPKRMEAGLLFSLTDSQRNGHCYLPQEELLFQGAKLLHCQLSDLEDSLSTLEDNGAIILDPQEGINLVYLPPLYEAECEISLRIGEMCQSHLKPPKKLKTIIKNIQTQQNITYSPEQCYAVELAAKHQILLLTGGPGTGKTTSLKAVLALFDTLELSTVLVAPTGRAAKRLGDLCQSEASTIHRLLEVAFDQVSGTLVFQRNGDEPISADAVIVDETSMVDVLLMSHLLDALPNGCRLILVGDPDQLPSVGPGNLFSDLISSGLIPMVRLSRIFRQAQESNIISNAHMVNQGITPDMAQRAGDFFFLPRHSPQDTLDTIVELCLHRLPKNMGVTPEQIQVLSPTRKNTTGTESLNLALQNALNPPSKNKNQRTYGKWIFREGDRVMQVKNNYDIQWKSDEKSGVGIFNGDIGTIDEVRSDLIVVSFEGRMVEYSTDFLAQLEPAYAITVHKAQGSEYDVVIFSAFDGAPMLLTRGILYTAITRSKTLFVGVGNPYVLAQMTENYQQTRRYSALQQRLEEEIDAPPTGEEKES